MEFIKMKTKLNKNGKLSSPTEVLVWYIRHAEYPKLAQEHLEDWLLKNYGHIIK